MVMKKYFAELLKFRRVHHFHLHAKERVQDLKNLYRTFLEVSRGICPTMQYVPAQAQRPLCILRSEYCPVLALCSSNARPSDTLIYVVTLHTVNKSVTC